MGSAIQDLPLRHNSDQLVRREKCRQILAPEKGQNVQTSVRLNVHLQKLDDRFVWARGLREDCRLKSSDKIVAQVIAEHFNPKFGYAFPSQETIAKKAGLSIATVERSIRRLKQTGWLEVRRVGVRISARYFLTAPNPFPIRGEGSREDQSPQSCGTIPLKGEGSIPSRVRGNLYRDQITYQYSSALKEGDEGTASASGTETQVKAPDEYFGRVECLWPETEEFTPSATSDAGINAIREQAILKVLGLVDGEQSKEMQLLQRNWKQLPAREISMIHDLIRADNLRYDWFAAYLLSRGFRQRMATDKT